MKFLTCISAALTVFLLAGLAPVAAQTCGDYPLTPKQADALNDVELEIVIPEGEVPFVQRCDIDGNEIIDRLDILEISRSRNQPASDPDDPRDWNENGVIDVLDARGCVLACTFPRCASTGPRTRVQAVQNTVGEPGECFQADDFDGDGKQDVVGIYEYTGDQTRGKNWNLQTVIVYENDDGEPQVVSFPYSGQTSQGGEEIQQHLSMQPAGPVDLNPGGVMLSRPGIVSYRNNKPKTLYYFQGGRWNRAYFGIDD